jgi:hypothetical protein
VIKTLISFAPPVIKAIMGALAFLVVLGWSSAIAIHALVRSEVISAKTEMRTIRDVDMEHIIGQFSTLNQKLDNVTNILIEREMPRRRK